MNLSHFFQSPVNLFLFRHLGPTSCYYYMQLLGKLYYLFNRKEKHRIERNISDMLGDLDGPMLRRMRRKTFRGIFAHYYEKMYSASHSFQDMRSFIAGAMEVKNLEVIDRALEQGRGIILVTAHYGGVEFIPWYLGLQGYPMSVVVECQTEKLKQFLDRQAVQFRDLELISSKDGTQIYPRILESLGRNRIVMTECDEVDTWRKRKNRTIRLFDRELYFDNTLDFIARRTGAAVIQVFMKRNSHRSYSLHVEEIQPQPDSTVAKEVMTLWQEYVERDPEQWYQWKKWQQMKAVS